jgi:hypothetical protein
MHFTGRGSKPTMSTRPASFSKRREVGFRGPFGAGPNGLLPRMGEDRDATQGRLTIQEAARRLGVKEDAVRKRIQRGVPATHARRTRPKTIDGAYQMQGSSGPLQMHPASQLRLNGVLRSSPRAGPPFARRRVAWDTGSFAPYYQGEHASRFGREQKGRHA